MGAQSKISIITVVYNGEKHLEETIKSVINQTYKNIEYIIIDGGSTDGTIDIIKKYKDKINICVSEKDKGIYDAMNKGIDLVSGDWINFMNVGDSFYNMSVIEDIFLNSNYVDIDVLYGNHKVVYPHRVRTVKAGNITNIWKGSQFCHQSAFVASNIHKENKFNLLNCIGADFELFYFLYKGKNNFKHVDIMVSNYSAEGLSDVKRIDSIVGRWNVIKKNEKTNFFYLYLIINEIIKIKIKKILRLPSYK
jgi:glycosyltransferase involved in cell wall biosynthesis